MATRFNPCIAIGVRDKTASAAVFCDLLGGEVTDRRDDWVEVSAGPFKFYFVEDGTNDLAFSVDVDDEAEILPKLLIGNFGDGKIHAYDLHEGELEGTLRDTNHQPIVIDGLWSLTFGMGGANSAGEIVNGLTTDLFFTAGTNDKADGLLGKITVDPHGHGNGDD